MKRKCNCAGACGPGADALSRREFIGLVGAGAALGAVALPSQADAQSAADELERWKRALLQPAAPRLYSSAVHTDARLHLGGIGTGNFELGADGQSTTWQLFNTLRDGQVPFHFGVKAGDVARLLQTTGGPEAPRVERIEMRGEYPFAFLRFLDAALPVNLELTAFSPFAPLNTRLSSVPLAAFVFRITNPSAQNQTVSLAAILQNPVGYDAIGALAGARHPNFGGNVNESFSEGPAKGILFRAVPGSEPALDVPVRLYVSASLEGLQTPPLDRPKNLALEALDRLPAAPEAFAAPARNVVWLEEPPADLPEPTLRRARDAVLAGATLVLAGKTMPLLAAYAKATGGRLLEQTPGRPDILFEDFEQDYGKWTVQGRAFGDKPATGTLPNQQRVSGFLGKGLVNTYFEGDGTTGRLVSRPFTIERNYIRFLVGGGAHTDTQIRLVVGDKVARSAAGRNLERLLPASWDVREFAGQTARLEIVDENQGGWGHVNVDQIEFADQPANRAVFLLLEELLPARFSGVRAGGPREPGGPNTVEFEGLELREGAGGSAAASGLRLLRRGLGKGQVVLAAGPVLEPEQAELVGARQRAYATLCGLVGANYVAPAGPLPAAPGFGTLALATLAENATVQCEFADVNAAWAEFAGRGGGRPSSGAASRGSGQRSVSQALAAGDVAAPGDGGTPPARADRARFVPLDQAKASQPTALGTTVTGAVAATVEVPANGTVEVPFLVTWRYPNKYSSAGVPMGCHYATQWADARAVMREAVESFAGWRETTERFRKTFYDSTLPYWLLDCVTSQAAIIRHIGVVFRIAKGDVYGWEGSNGCCQPTCTHVWGYEQTLARLFPDLEKDMRRIDYLHQQRPDGGINNRTDVPSPPHPTGEQPFADGHASCILKAWREALNHPDDSWLKEYWPRVKRAVEYLIARDAATAGGEPAGVLRDDQWNTYDEALHGVTTFIGTYYLAALRAGEEWARRMGDQAAAERFHGVCEKGRQKLIELCWNGEYFQQHLPDYLNRSGEVGPGCMSDQLIGQWWAHQLGLGYLLPKDMVQSALRAVFNYNWKPDLTGWRHSPRAFAGDRDKGLIICTWPKGGRPASVMLYSDEVWTGIEYQVAAHLIYEGMIEEGFAIVKGARDRYDGVPRAPIGRNPWNEIECGGHYARAMSSWSLLLALTGWEYDGPRQALRFAPRCQPDNFRAFFCGPEGWGSLRQTRDAQGQTSEITVAEGALDLRRLVLASPSTPKTIAVHVGQRQVGASFTPSAGEVLLVLESPLRLSRGETMSIRLG